MKMDAAKEAASWHIECTATSAGELFRQLREFCRMIHCGHKRPEAQVIISGNGITFKCKGDWTMDVKDTAGPFALDVSLFIDAKDNPTTDADIPVYSVDNADVATVVANDPAGADPQGALLTLTGKLGQVNVSATFGDPAAGGFVVTSNGAVNVLPGAAVSATMTIKDTAAP